MNQSVLSQSISSRKLGRRHARRTRSRSLPRRPPPPPTSARAPRRANARPPPARHSSSAGSEWREDLSISTPPLIPTRARETVARVAWNARVSRISRAGALDARPRAMPRVARAMAPPTPTVPQRLLVGDDARALLEHIEETVRDGGDPEGAVERRRAYVRAGRGAVGEGAVALGGEAGPSRSRRAVRTPAERTLIRFRPVDIIMGKQRFFTRSRARGASVSCIGRDTARARVLTHCPPLTPKTPQGRCRHVSRGERGKGENCNNKGQSVLSLALSHCKEETIEVIKRAEEQEKTRVEFPRYSQRRIKVRRFRRAVLSRSRGRAWTWSPTRESRRRNFSRLNKGVSWENPDGIDLSAERKRAGEEEKGKRSRADLGGIRTNSERSGGRR